MSMTPPTVTHCFSIEDESSDGTHRKLAVLVADQGETQFQFSTQRPGEEMLKSTLTLGKVALSMLDQAMNALNKDLSRFALEPDAS